MKQPILMKAIILTVVLAASTALSQSYTPDVAEFDGTTTLAFDPAPELSLADGGTLEFWVAADWTEDPGYDPVIVSNAGPEGAAYMIAMLRDRDGLGIRAGEQEGFAAFDFTDQRLHHVALSYAQGTLAVLIDGGVRALLEITVDDLPSDGFWVGTADGSTAPFIGAVAGLRVWRVPLAQQEIVDYAAANLLADDTDHPALAYLGAISDFRIDELYITEVAADAMSDTPGRN